MGFRFLYKKCSRIVADNVDNVDGWVSECSVWSGTFSQYLSKTAEPAAAVSIAILEEGESERAE